MRGVVKSVKEAFGFIQLQDGRDAYYHNSQLKLGYSPCPGDMVEFDLVSGPKGPVAKAVTLVAASSVGDQPSLADMLAHREALRASEPISARSEKGWIDQFHAGRQFGFITLQHGGPNIHFKPRMFDSSRDPKRYEWVEVTLNDYGKATRLVVLDPVILLQDVDQEQPLQIITAPTTLTQMTANFDALPNYDVRGSLTGEALALYWSCLRRKGLQEWYAEFSHRAASAFLEAEMLDIATSRARQGFKSFAASMPIHRCKEKLHDFAEVLMLCLVRGEASSLRNNPYELNLTMEEMLRGLYLPSQPVPHATFQRSQQILCYEFERQRKLIEGDDAQLADFIVRYFPLMTQLKLGNDKRARAIIEKWESLGAFYCPSFVSESATRSDGLLNVLFEDLAALQAASQGSAATIPSELLETVDTIAARVSSELQNRAERKLIPQRPQKRLMSRRKAVERNFELAMDQLNQQPPNYDGALRTLDGTLGGELFNSSLWEWFSYVKLCVGRAELDVLRHIASARSNDNAPNNTLTWNAALCHIRLGQVKEALKELAHCELPNVETVILAQACKSGEWTVVVDKCLGSDALEFIVLGYRAALNSTRHAEARTLLSKLVVKLTSMKDDFAPLPVDEILTEREIESTLAHYVKYGFEREGVAHFKSRLARNQQPKYQLLLALGQLEDQLGNIDGASACFSESLKLTISSKVPSSTKEEAMRWFLDYCLRRRSLKIGKEFLESNRSVLSQDEYSRYCADFFVDTFDDPPATSTNVESDVPLVVDERPVKARVEDLPPIAVVTRTEVPSHGIADQVSKAKQRLAQLNLRLGRVQSMFQLSERREEFEEYADCIATSLGEKGANVASKFRSLVAHLGSAATEKVSSLKEAALEQAKVARIQLTESLRDLTVDECAELTAINRFNSMIGAASVTLGKINLPTLTVPDGRVFTGADSVSVAVKIENPGPCDFEEVTIKGDSVKGLVQLGESLPLSLSQLGSGVATYVSLPVSVESTAGEDTLSLYSTSKSEGIEELHSPHVSLKLSIRPFQRIPRDRYVVGMAVNTDRPKNFHGRGPELEKTLEFLSAAERGARGVIYLDGIKQVGKSSLLNFIRDRLPPSIRPIRFNMMHRDFVTTGQVLHTFVREAGRQLLGSDEAADESAGAASGFEERPIESFGEALKRLRATIPGQSLVVIIDEVQELIRAIAEAEKVGRPLNSKLLNAWQAEREESGLLFILTGSLRTTKVSKYLQHAFFRRVNRIEVSFLGIDATRDSLQIPVLEDGVVFVPEATNRVYTLTKGYPSLVQRLGDQCVELLNQKWRQVVIPADVEEAAARLLGDAALFQYWWDSDFLEEREERVIRKFLELTERQPELGVTRERLLSELQDLGADCNIGLTNLGEQQIVEQTELGRYRIKGDLLRQWLVGKFVENEDPIRMLKSCMLVVDHENLFMCMRDTLKAGNVHVDVDVAIQSVVSSVVQQVKRFGTLAIGCAVAVWGKGYLQHQMYYKKADPNFQLPWPPFAPQASDGELRRMVCEQIEHETVGKRLIGTVILVSGDGHFGPLVSRLRSQGRQVIVWSWANHISDKLRESASRFESLEEICSIDDLRPNE